MLTTTQPIPTRPVLMTDYQNFQAYAGVSAEVAAILSGFKHLADAVREGAEAIREELDGHGRTLAALESILASAPLGCTHTPAPAAKRGRPRKS